MAMLEYCMEIRSTSNWSDCRYRKYTTSKKLAEQFKTFPKIQFTDSGHGLVPSVSERSGNRKVTINTLWEEVEKHFAEVQRQSENAMRKRSKGATRMQLDLAREEIARLEKEVEALKEENARLKRDLRVINSSGIQS